MNRIYIIYVLYLETFTPFIWLEALGAVYEIKTKPSSKHVKNKNTYK